MDIVGWETVCDGHRRVVYHTCLCCFHGRVVATIIKGKDGTLGPPKTKKAIPCPIFYRSSTLGYYMLVYCQVELQPRLIPCQTLQIVHLVLSLALVFFSTFL
jgi:hypothetical protein